MFSARSIEGRPDGEKVSILASSARALGFTVEDDVPDARPVLVRVGDIRELLANPAVAESLPEDEDCGCYDEE